MIAMAMGVKIRCIQVNITSLQKHPKTATERTGTVKTKEKRNPFGFLSCAVGKLIIELS